MPIGILGRKGLGPFREREKEDLLSLFCLPLASCCVGFVFLLLFFGYIRPFLLLLTAMFLFYFLVAARGC